MGYRHQRSLTVILVVILEFVLQVLELLQDAVDCERLLTEPVLHASRPNPSSSATVHHSRQAYVLPTIVGILKAYYGPKLVQRTPVEWIE